MSAAALPRTTEPLLTVRAPASFTRTADCSRPSTVKIYSHGAYRRAVRHRPDIGKVTHRWCLKYLPDASRLVGCYLLLMSAIYRSLALICFAQFAVLLHTIDKTVSGMSFIR